MRIITAFLTVAITLATVQASIGATTPEQSEQPITPPEPPHRGNGRR